MLLPVPAKSLRTLSLLTVLLYGAVSCDDQTTGGPNTPADTAGWSMSSVPKVRIGAAAGAADYELSKVFGGLITLDGGVVVGNSGTSEIRRYDRTGRYLATSGRQGSGPGEFRSISWMGPYRGDSIVVYDMRSQRFSVLGPGGEFSRVLSPGTTAGPVRPLGIFSDGAILLAVEKAYDPRTQSGRTRDAVSLYTLSPDGVVSARIGTYPGSEWLLYGAVSSYRSTRLPFGRTGMFAVWSDRIVRASSDSARLEVQDRAGKRLAAIDLAVRERRLTRAEIDDGTETAIPDRRDREVIERELRRHPPEWAPLITELRAGRDGNLWIRTYPARNGALVKWLIVSPAGERIGSAMLPADWRPLDIVRGRLLVREQDAAGIERVSIRSVVR